MPRYIDADELYKKLYPLDLADKRKYTINAKAVADAIANIPTADVVPKSEVEELKAIIADHKANEERWQELYADTVDKWEKAYEELEIKLENAKTEVAREIFEELIDNATFIEYADGGKYLRYNAEFVAELKKKYLSMHLCGE